MEYDKWIERERRIRIKILKSSPLIQKDFIYRVCIDCEEVLLCHEEECPNCGSMNVVGKKLDFIDNINHIEDRIRCCRRFINLTKEGA